WYCRYCRGGIESQGSAEYLLLIVVVVSPPFRHIQTHGIHPLHSLEHPIGLFVADLFIIKAERHIIDSLAVPQIIECPVKYRRLMRTVVRVSWAGAAINCPLKPPTLPG